MDIQPSLLLSAPDRMPEAEVTLRTAFALLATGNVASDVSVAIDGAQVKIGAAVHFEISEFLAINGWSCTQLAQGWRGRYTHPAHVHGVIVHSASGCGDVVATLQDGRTVRAESKKGPLVDSASSAEYPLLREALGQLMTIGEQASSDLLAVVVPESRKFRDLANKWRRAPLIAKLGIQIWTISRSNVLSGFDESDG